MNTAAQLTNALAGRYTIEREIGAGGMATVYLAQDVKHRRRVAVKVLRPELAAVVGTERFLAEIAVTASLQHPHLLPLFDSGEANGLLYYVMPYIEGETLRRRLARERQLSVEEAVRITRAVASALDYAHRRNVIHRDLKPENILLHEGEPLVADFGIALALSNAGGERITQSGISLGTPQYMSPEQAAGDRQIDARSDVYSLGTVLYEMLAGEPPHAGPTVQAVISKVLAEEPRPINVLRKTVPDVVSAALERALAKVPADRFASAGEFAAQLSLSEEGATTARPTRSRADTTDVHVSRSTLWIAAGIGIMLAAAATALGLKSLRSSTSLPALTRLELLPPEHTSFAEIAISPDGRRIAFTAADSAGHARLYVRALDATAAQALAGADGAQHPFWSPDSRQIGFFADDKVKKIDADGGEPFTVCPLVNSRGGPGGGTWSPSGVIVFGVVQFHSAPLYQVSDRGGEPRPVRLERGGDQSNHFWPSFLPDGRHFLYLVLNSANEDSTGAWVASLDGDEARFLGKAEASAVFARSPGAPPSAAGHLLFVRDGALLAEPFDPRTRTAVGDPVPIASRVGAAHGERGGLAKISVSENGILVYGAGSGVSQLTWIDRRGAPIGTLGSSGIHIAFRISPDGRRVAVQRENVFGRAQLYMMPVGGGPMSQLTFEPFYHAEPVWLPDGTRVTYFVQRDEHWSLWEKATTGEGDPAPLFKSSHDDFVPDDWSPDGRRLLYTDIHATGSTTEDDLCVFTRKETPSDSACAAPFARTPANENFARFSPDGRWVAYYTNQSGKYEIYVRPFPPTTTGSGGKQVSSNGGIEPRWRGNEIFYISPDNMLMAVPVKTGPVFEMTGAPHPLFRTRPAGVERYDVTADGQRFLVAVPADESWGGPATVVLNWPEELKRGGRTARP